DPAASGHLRRLVASPISTDRSVNGPAGPRHPFIHPAGGHRARRLQRDERKKSMKTTRLLSRRSLLQGGVALGAAFAAAGLAAPTPAAAAGLTVSRIKVLAGTQSPVQYGIG